MSAKTLLSALLCFVFSFSLSNAFAQDKTVTGKVIDSKDGMPVVGATVQAKGSRSGTSTKSDGTFSLSVPSTVTTLVISSVGYTAQEVSIAGLSNVEVSFVPSAAASLNEIVVTGYGTARKRDVTGSVTSVKEKDFNKGIVTGADQLIQGKVAGVQVLNNSGAPGGGTTVRIRGNSSVRTGGQPLFVIDGVPLDGRTARPGVDASGIGQTPGANPLNFINPNDIASIDILKDASATAIYGSRGANGVVIITTKRGKTGAPSLDFNLSVGISKVLRKYDVLSGDEYRKALTDYGIATGNLGGNVDAQDAILRTAMTHNYNIAIGSGNENGRYRLSASYLNQEGIVRKSGFQKYTANLTSNYKFLSSKRLGIDFNVLTSYNKEKIAPISNNAGFTGSLLGQALQWNPTRPLRKPDGSLDIEYGSTTVNPLAMSEAYDDNSNVSAVLASISPNYKITADLEYRMLFSVKREVGIRRTQMSRFINIENVANRGWANIAQSELNTQQFTHTLSYNKKVTRELNLNAVIGYEFQKFDNKGAGEFGRDFLTTYIPYTNYIQNSTQDTRSIYSYADPISELQSYFGRVSFNLSDKYLLTATMRADGSSKFGENNKYGYFPSLAAAWNISNEDFFVKGGLVNNLKLRLGWGKTGNQEFPAGAAEERYGFGAGSLFQVNVANPDLKWETSTTINAGLEFTLLKDRITGTVEYFNKKTTDLLFNFDAIQPAPATKYWINLDGEVVNKGFEVALNALVIKQRDLTWNLGGNVSFLKNELSNYNGPTVLTGGIHGQGVSGSTVQRLANNRPLNSFYVREFLGIDKTTGNSIYTDNGNTFYYIGNPNPKVLLGINTEVVFKKLTFTANMNGAYGHDIYNNTLNSVIPIGNLNGSRNIASSLLNTGIKESVSNALTTSSRYLEKGNYLKLANATLAYNLGNIGKELKGLNIFITGQNLFIITKFKGFDPEVNTDKQVDGVPSFGIEYIPYPTARSFMLGVNFSL